MPYKLGKALAYAVLIWVVGFVWGSVVFMIPSWWNVPAIPYLWKNPVISFPILLMWIPMTLFLSKGYLRSADGKATEGLKLGLMLSVINIVLDLLILIVMLKAGFSYFVSATVWLGYALLLLIPWRTGYSLQKNHA
jgi:hypothetical protein